MLSNIEEKKINGKSFLCLTDGKTDVKVALDYGIRVAHVSVAGMDNLFYEQPDDLSDGLSTDDGWRLYGGHRIWNTPEDDTNAFPDNNPVFYSVIDNGVLIRQEIESWRQIEKELEIVFLSDGRIKVTNFVRNKSEHAIDTAAWGVNTLKPGKVDVDFESADVSSAGYPSRHISLWGDTSIADERITWSKHHLTAVHKPIGDYFKLGMYTKSGKAYYESLDQKFTLEFSTDNFGNYPDGGCNFELWLNKFCLEIESLGIVAHLLPNESAVHTEYWKLEKIN